MRGFIGLWLGQLYKLLVIWPAWLLTPEGLKALRSPRNLWRIAMGLVFALALVALAQTLPADMALIGAGDLMAYVDVAALAWLAGAGVLVRYALKQARRLWAKGFAVRKAQVAVRRERRTALRHRRPKRPPPPANDDSVPGVRWTVAA